MHTLIKNKTKTNKFSGWQHVAVPVEVFIRIALLVDCHNINRYRVVI